MALTIRGHQGPVEALVLFLAGLVAPQGAWALTVVAPLQFSHSAPGARSLGFGGAFIGLADDATAAFANPAGLVQLLVPEVSVEGRNWGYSTPFTAGGRVENPPSGFGIDVTSGLRTETSRYDATGLSFMSVALPKGDWSIAFFRHEYADLKFSSETQGLFGGGSQCCVQRILDQRATNDLDVVGHGLAVARRLGDTVSVGVGVTHYDASMIGAVQEFLWDDDSIESFFAPSSYLSARLHLEETVRIRGDDWALTGGILWRPTENWSIGAVYQQGLDARVDLEMIAGPASDMGVPPGSVLVRRTGIPIHFPDAYGLGAAYRASDGRLTLSVQWDRVEYSDLMRSVEAEGVAIDDADQLHIGAEYVFLDWTPIIAVRFGAWREPDHQVHSTSNDVWERALLPRRRDETHYAVGFGAAMRRFQVDFAVDLAKRVNTVSLSAIYNF